MPPIIGPIRWENVLSPLLMFSIICLFSATLKYSIKDAVYASINGYVKNASVKKIYERVVLKSDNTAISKLMHISMKFSPATDSNSHGIDNAHMKKIPAKAMA